MFTPTNLKANWLELQRAHAVACLAQSLARHNHFLMLSFFGNGFWLYAAISQSFHIKLILLRFICLLFLLTRTNYVAPPTHSWRLFYYCATSCATHTPQKFLTCPSWQSAIIWYNILYIEQTFQKFRAVNQISLKRIFFPNFFVFRCSFDWQRKYNEVKWFHIQWKRFCRKANVAVFFPLFRLA